MPDHWTQGKTATTCKALAGLIGAAGCLAAAAYAGAGQISTSPASGNRGESAATAGRADDHASISRRAGKRRAGKRPPKPRITRHPAKESIATSAMFRVAARRRGLRFECKLDRRRWKRCRKKITYPRLPIGRHRFAVRARDQAARRSRAARFKWKVVAPESFSIAPQTPSPRTLYPGAAPVAVPVLIANPKPVPIYVTSLEVEVTSSPAGCDSAMNLALSGSSASSSAPLMIPARGSVSLPAPGVSAPAIRLLDLPINQDACKNAQFTLAFHGSAHG